MLKKVAIFVFVLACLCYAASFTTTHGKLKVVGGKIQDKNNNEIVLRGMSLYWYQGPWSGGQPGDQFYTSNVVSGLANNWNANVVRAAIGNVQQSPSTALTMAKNMMDWANSAGIYVIIDNHSHIAHRSVHATAANNFFREVSAYVKSKSYTHVLYEIYNEPVYDNDTWNAHDSPSNATRTTWAQIKSYSQTIISTIRANDADGLIIVGTPYYSSGISTARADPINGQNLLYALHFYAGEAAHSNYREAVKGAYCNNFPIFASEWGTSPASGNGNINTSNSNTWLNLLETAKYSHANWSLSNASETSAALNSADINGSLKASGTYIKNIFRLNTSGTSLSSVGLSQLSLDCSSNVPWEPDGIIKMNTSALFSNTQDKDGVNVISSDYGDVFVNASANFSAGYTITEIPHPGIYKMDLTFGSTAGGTVFWSGPNIENGQAQIENNGNLNSLKNTGWKLIKIGSAPDAPINFSIQTSSANSVKAYFIRLAKPNAEDSVTYGIKDEPVVPVIAQNSAKLWSYNSATATFNFDATDGTLAIYNLRGERKAIFAAKGNVSIKENLAAGTYLAIYRRGYQVEAKTIYLK